MIKPRTALSLSPLCVMLFAGAAHADLSPYSFSASETVSHQSNLYRTSDQTRQGDWISTTEFGAALDQAVGRDRLIASARIDFDRYKHQTRSNGTGYSLAGAFDWNTVGDLSGTIGADSSRRQYFYGLTSDSGPSSTRNFQTDNHVFTTVQLGSVSRWTLFAGMDANQRNYSASSFAANEERQWSAHAGTSYATSPDLSFGLTGNYTHGTYPNAKAGQSDEFDLKSLDATTKWQATGNSAFDGQVGYSTQQFNGQSSTNFVNGAANWTWTPPSHFTIRAGLSRDSDSDAASGNTVSNNDINGRSLNTAAHLNLSYALTAKITLGASGQYTQRHYSHVSLLNSAGVLVAAEGTNRTAYYALTAHYLPTRTTDLSCSVAREVRRSDQSISTLTPAYKDNTVSCTAAIRFN